MPIDSLSLLGAATFFAAVLVVALACALIQAWRHNPPKLFRRREPAVVGAAIERKNTLGQATLLPQGGTALRGHLDLATVAGALRLSMRVERAPPGTYQLLLGEELDGPQSGRDSGHRGPFAPQPALQEPVRPLRDLGRLVAGQDGCGALTLFFLPSAFPHEHAAGWRLAGRAVELRGDGKIVAAGVIAPRCPSPGS